MTKPLLLKIDQNFGSSHRFFMTVFRYKRLKEMDSVQASNLNSFNHLPNEGTQTHNKSYQAWTFNYTYTISPAMVNNVAVGVKRSQRALAHQGNPDLPWDRLGMPQMRADTGGSLDQAIVQVGSGVNGFQLFGGYDDVMHENAIYAADNLYWVKGRHAVQAGFDLRIPNESKLQNWYAAGAFGFSAFNLGSTGNPPPERPGCEYAAVRPRRQHDRQPAGAASLPAVRLDFRVVQRLHVPLQFDAALPGQAVRARFRRAGQLRSQQEHR